MSMMDKMMKCIEESFTDNDVSFFFGGSRRFGYDTNRSDIDVHVFLDHTQPHTVLCRIFGNVKYLMRAGHCRQFRYDAPESTLFEAYGIVHIVSYRTREAFEEVKRQHERVQNLLTDNPILIDTARAMRKSGISGSSVFKILDGIAQDQML